MTDETELNARFDLLVAQRNNALNQNVLDAGVIAALKAKIKALEALTPAVAKEDEIVMKEKTDA